MAVRILFLILCLYGFPFSGNTQQSSKISGYVKDAEGPLPDVTVLIKGAQQGTVTDKNGYFEFTGLKPARTTIIVSYIGYLTQEIAVNAAQNPSLEFTLVKEGGQLEDVRVIA